VFVECSEKKAIMVYKIPPLHAFLFLSFLLCFTLLEEVAPHDSSSIDGTVASVGESQQCHESSSANCKNEDDDNNNKERVVFGGKLELHSKPLPRSVTRNSIIRFFSEEQETNVRIIASAGGDRVTERITSTVELENYWYETCHDTYGVENCLPSSSSEDEDSDPIIYATNTTTQFKGLFFKLTTTSYNGVKTIIPRDEEYDNNDNNDDKKKKEEGNCDKNGSDSVPMPKYVFNMIAEQQHPEGPAPIVWAFHKICGFCAERDSLKPCGRVQAIMSATKVVVGDEQQEAVGERHHRPPSAAPPDYYDYYALTFSVNIHIQIEFPKRLSKFLPLKKDNGIETKVSKQILSILSKDIERNLQVFHERFLNWLDDDDSDDDGNTNGDDDDDGRCH
jgi:hypothetical protein